MSAEYEAEQNTPAKQIERLKAENASLQQLVCDFQAASMLVDSSGDPGTIGPKHVKAEIGKLRGMNDVYQNELRHTERELEERIAEIERLREENAQIAQSAIDIVTVECERPEHKALNFGEWMEQGGGACSVCMTEKLASAEQRAARAELLVRLLQCGEVIFNRATETVFTATEELPYDHTTWTDEQWERLAELKRGGT